MHCWWPFSHTFGWSILANLVSDPSTRHKVLRRAAPGLVFTFPVYILCLFFVQVVLYCTINWPRPGAVFDPNLCIDDDTWTSRQPRCRCPATGAALLNFYRRFFWKTFRSDRLKILLNFKWCKFWLCCVGRFGRVGEYSLPVLGALLISGSPSASWTLTDNVLLTEEGTREQA